ncbi:MAG: ATP-binding cassette domain-containing protein [Sedimentisphaerales bacterium]|nr:ATP-binding cassette domain-containing protein [Sedimentisphaerales bacterium]
MIKLKNVTKVYPNGVQAVSHLTLDIADGETLVLLGTSGCGKTTTMKMVNRLIEPTSGDIYINHKHFREYDPINLRRSIGFAIQHIGLFPHLNVFDNIAVVPRLLQWSQDKIKDRIDQLLRRVGLEPEEFSHRYPRQLSGGQKQRVGVVRALAADPPIILMDEPFGALDPITREQLQNEFIELESEINKTILFVTHDIFEAVKMGDRIALLDQGVLQQVATPAVFVEKPENEFVEQFLGIHRFQLSLMTRTLKTIQPALTIDESLKTAPLTGRYLTEKSTLIDALDMFRREDKSLPVYRRNQYLGHLERKTVLKEIIQIIDDGAKTA